MAEDLIKRGYKGTIAFPPGFIDGRAFQWRNCAVRIRYSFVSILPHDSSKVDQDARNKIRKAETKVIL